MTSIPEWNIDASANKFINTYVKGFVDVSGGDVILRTGKIRSATNTIEFDDTYQFTNFLNSVNIYGQQKLTYNSIEYDVGLQCEKTDTLVSDVATISPIVSDTAYKTIGFYWDSGLSTTVFNNNASFPNGSISSTAINNTSFVSKSGAETIDGIKTFNSAPVMSGASITNLSIPVGKITGTAVALTGAQTITATKTFSVVQNFSNNIRLDGSLLLSSGTITITNADMQKISFLNTATSNIQTQINNINAVTLAGSNIFTGTTNQFTNNIRLDGSLLLSAGTLTLTNANLQKLQYLSTVSSDIQTQVNTLTTNSAALAASNTFSGATNQFSNNMRLDGSLLLNTGLLTLTNANLQKVQYLSTVSSDIQTQVTNLGTRATTLETKTTKMSYMSVGGINTTTILDGLISQTLSFTNTINNISTTTFGYISGLTSSAQSQISTLATKLTDTSYSGTTTTIANSLVFTGTLNNISTTVYGYLSGVTSSIQTQLTNLGYAVNPVGTIIMSPLSDIQTTSSNKYLLCDGQSVGRSSYPNLFAKVGTTFGSADPFSFSLPCYSGAFLRGYGQQMVNGQIYEGNFTVNTPQQDAIQEHNHWGQTGSYCGSNRASGVTNAFSSGGFYPQTYNFDQTGLQSTGRSDSGETRPMNYSVYYYIKS